MPIHYVRRQTLKNAERYIIPELKEYEDKVLTSKGKALAIEKSLYDELFDLLLPHGGTAAKRRRTGRAGRAGQSGRARRYPELRLPNHE